MTNADPAMPGRVLTVGESMLLITPQPLESLATAAHASLDVAGAESTVATYLAELGHRTTWISAVGDDPIGRRIVAAVSGAGIDTTFVRTDTAAPSGVYFKDPGPDGRTSVHYYRRWSAASRMTPAALSRVPIESFDLIHVTGITPALSSSCRELIDQLLDAAGEFGVPVSFDVNHRSGLWSAEEASGPLREIADRAEIVFVGLDEACHLWSCATEEEVREFLPGPATLVVKDGPIKSTAFHAGGRDEVPAFTVEVVEPVGAGDAFAAGYLHGLLTGESQRNRLRFGHLLARASLLATGDVGVIPDELRTNPLTVRRRPGTPGAERKIQVTQ